MNPRSAGNNPHRRRRRFSWAYDEDHHIGQYSDENTLLPINENYYQSEDDQENSYEYSYDCDEYDDCETDDSGMDLCEPEAASRQQEQQQQQTQPTQQQQQSLHHPHHQTSGNSGMGKRRRRPLRKVLGKGWEIPSPAVMKRRSRFRQIVDDETRRHRRILPSATNNSNNNEINNNTNGAEARSKNVLHLLRDRELYGGGSSNGGIRSSIRRSSRSYSHRHTTDELRTYAEQACVTKFESSYLTHLQHEIVEAAPPEAASNEGGSNGNNNSDNSNNGTSNADSQNNGSDANSNPSRPNGNQPNATQTSNNNNASSKAVSTISIAFSPDGKTMASTHGDHTVKITCCMTGKLLQTLVGHPRTPWTVKYHPHAGADLKNPKTKKVIIANRTANTNSILNNNANTNAASQQDSSQQQQQQQEYDQQQQQQIVASGCLGHQVRIWDWISGTCLQMIRLEFAIISLSFHPAGNVLAIANGTRLHFWGLPTVTQAEKNSQENSIEANAGEVGSGGNDSSAGSSTATTNNNIQPRRGMHIEMRHMLRCVHFLPDGKRVIVGGVNPQTQAEIRRQRRLAAEGNQEKVPTMSFYLRLWDFDLEAARGPVPLSRQVVSRQGNAGGIAATQGGSLQNAVSAETGTSSSSSSQSTANNNNSSSNSGNTTTSSGTTSQQQAMIESAQAAAALGTTTRRRRAISNPRCFVPRALLYNDGGFDVSPDGKTLCACAEYWLPEGVDNATDLLHPPEKEDENQDDDYDSSSDESRSDDEGGSQSGDKDKSDVTMDDVSGEEADKNLSSPKESTKKTDKYSVVAADSSGSAPSVNAKEDNTSTEKTTEESKRDVNNTSPTRLLASSNPHPPSATPPRILGRQQQPISSPPLALGATASSSGSGAYGLPMPPMQVGLEPQTPPPNVNPLNFPLSPPSPPGRRFAGGLNRGAQPPSQQHEQLLQQYNRQQAMLNQHRLNQQQQNMPPPQQQRGGSVYTPPSQRIENTSTTIPAPPRINHRNNRQHRLHANKSAMQKAGNPFGATSRNARGGANPNSQRGRFVPHVVTISLDTEPFVETTTEEVVIGHGEPNMTPGDAAVATGRILSTTVAETSRNGGTSNTTIVTKTTYNIPGRGAAFSATRPHVLERRPRLGQLLSACPLDGAKASAVTCVKFSPCTDFCLIGYGVREPHVEENGESNDSPAHPPYHPVTAMYKVNKGGNMRHVSTMLSGDDDVNISRFHPDSGYGFVYGTKQGRIRILGPRPWNYYNC